MTAKHDPFNSKATLSVAGKTYTYYALEALQRKGVGTISKLPYSIRVILESMLRSVDGFTVTADDVTGLAGYNAKSPAKEEIPFMVGRVVLQDFTGVPCVVDLAAMRDAMKALGGNPAAINPLVPCDLVIDHSVQVDAFASSTALTINNQKEFERNNERYEFLKWGQQSLRNFRCVPPATGIVHQVNLEYLSPGVLTKQVGNETVAYPDSCVGTDSHTTMINGLGVVGWGVGGIEAEAVMLGQPYYMLPPEVIGFKLVGKLPEGATATDLVLTVTQMLRKKGVVDKFVEFFGPGIAALSVPDRATIANMAPEYGATMGFFPVDQTTIDYLNFTGRAEAAALTAAYAKANHLWWEPTSPDPVFTDVLELDLSTVQPSLAGPKRPQDRVELKNVKAEFLKSLGAPLGNTAFGLGQEKIFGAFGTYKNPTDSSAHKLTHGAVVIAAITSCTNTSNPDVLIAAGLVARKAHALGLTRKPWVKTSLAPGSRVVTDYLDKAKLTTDLEALGFHTVGYGCTTCIGNSGPLPEEVEAFIKEGDLVAASVLSGNRNFEGRVHPAVKANYLASPPLVVAYAIAGSVAIDLATEPLGTSRDGKPVFLKDIWPTHAEVQALKAQCVTPEQFKTQYAKVFTANDTWNAVPVSKSDLYAWNDKSTYIQLPPYFQGMGPKPAEGAMPPIKSARVLVSVADSVTTDHISPAGDIAEKSPAGEYLKSLGVPRSQFNSYGSRRGNDRVMTRGTFANVRVKNKLTGVSTDGQPATVKEGWWTRDFTQPNAPVATIFDASANYRKAGTPLIVLAGKDYGMGSSRDWAAKGTMLLGVKAVIAESFERIHRGNLVGMGVLPLTFKPGQTADSLGICPTDTFDIHLPAEFTPRGEIKVTATATQGAKKGQKVEFSVICRLDTAVEITYFRNGGILQTVLRKLLSESRQPAMAGV
ncbi:MAG: aconitate hydratase AcnA [Planctomycetaceae bacterium]|jgi:aconitate hydratase|nr:aconitate hydratase AcnA [Planctomycetaceae bacterium]